MDMRVVILCDLAFERSIRFLEPVTDPPVRSPGEPQHHRPDPLGIGSEHRENHRRDGEFLDKKFIMDKYEEVTSRQNQMELLETKYWINKIKEVANV